MERGGGGKRRRGKKKRGGGEGKRRREKVWEERREEGERRSYLKLLQNENKITSLFYYCKESTKSPHMQKLLATYRKRQKC